jgi:hypothetical protein
MSDAAAVVKKLSINWTDILITAAIAAAVVYAMTTPQARRSLPTTKPTP